MEEENLCFTAQPHTRGLAPMGLQGVTQWSPTSYTCTGFVNISMPTRGIARLSNYSRSYLKRTKVVHKSYSRPT